MEKTRHALKQLLQIVDDLCGQVALIVGGVLVLVLADNILHTHYRAQLIAGLTPHWWAIGLGILNLPIFLCISIGSAAVMGWLSPPDSSTPSDGTAVDVVTGVAGGISEEMVLRGVVQNIAGFWFATAAFALLHYSNRRWWGDVGRTFLPGAFLGAAYFITGNLWVGITMHTLTNLLAFLPSTNNLVQIACNRVMAWLESWEKPSED